ncbi:MAG: N-acetyltransferase [Bryobacteraceae bacterium]
MRNAVTNVLEDIEPLAISPALSARKAAMRDIPALLRLINHYAAEGIMLPRTEFEISENIRDFTVIYSGPQLLGCGALHFYTPTSGEIRSLAVAPEARKQGVGVFLTTTLEKEAINNDLQAIFAFTYVPDFFRKLGFRQVDRGLLPLKVWKDCLSCPKFQCCDEIAVLKALTSDTPPALSLDYGQELVQLPTTKRV